MKASVKGRFRNYFNRFLDPNISFKQKWVSFWRYLGMAFGLIFEKIKGVDYEMIYQEDNGVEHCGNYTMSPKKVLKRVFNDIENIETKAFIDIGCGKGYAVKMAHRRGFRLSGGIEYNRYLYDICIKNLKNEGIPIENVYCGMAQEFDGYSEYDVFYFNNPFQADILSDVLKKVYASHEGRFCICYYLNLRDKLKEEAFIDNGFELVKVIEDPAESYFKMNVYAKKE